MGFFDDDEYDFASDVLSDAKNFDIESVVYLNRWEAVYRITFEKINDDIYCDIDYEKVGSGTISHSCKSDTIRNALVMAFEKAGIEV